MAPAVVLPRVDGLKPPLPAARNPRLPVAVLISAISAAQVAAPAEAATWAATVAAPGASKELFFWQFCWMFVMFFLHHQKCVFCFLSYHVCFLLLFADGVVFSFL